MKRHVACACVCMCVVQLAVLLFEVKYFGCSAVNSWKQKKNTILRDNDQDWLNGVKTAESEPDATWSQDPP